MRAAVSLLALSALALILFVSSKRSAVSLPSRELAMEMDVRILSQASPVLARCASNGRMQRPGIQVGARNWQTLGKRKGGLAVGRILADGSCDGLLRFELRRGIQDQQVLQELQELIEGTPPGAHLALTALGNLAEGEFAQGELTEILARLGSTGSPIGRQHISWALLSSRMQDGTWLARGETLEPEGCAELWVSLPR
jgi:hypothetical protein